ncbi:YidC/Oxa1 family membrane protein insertase [Candidatus Nomurabacteria bacterium]|nr:YidC/Oxa1 family membrane protein insertase [Candidatus Nomurabacteria bacterium]
MFADIWFSYLYQPIFNLLIWVYNNWTDQNLGWAVVYVTVFLQVALLPFSLINARNTVINREIAEDVKRISKEFNNDPVQRKEEIRKILKRRNYSPWSKTFYLGIQAVFLILLYQVFIDGIQGKHVVELLYKSVDFPGAINTDFYGFDLGQTHTLVWPAIVVALIYIEIYFDFRKRSGKLKKTDLTYFLLFPTVVLVTLYVLPMVKSLYVLVSMLLAIVIGWFASLVFSRPKKKAK